MTASLGPVRVGLLGTSWWADAMYAPALRAGEGIEITAVAGRDRERAEAFARRWEIPRVFTDPEAMLASGLFEAVIIATPNATHHPFARRALEQDLHVLCEKPLALDYAQARELAELAAARKRITLVPFTYRYMPTTRYLKRLLDEGYLGHPYHLQLRYFAGFGREGAYSWRFDRSQAGAGAVGDIGSHFLYLAEWLFGEITALCARLDTLVERPERDPEGRPYEALDDTAMVLLRFSSGAQGFLHASTLAFEPTPFGQVHEMDLHGSAGTLRHRIDWDRRQELWGARAGEEAARRLELPDEAWGRVRRDVVTETYKDVFRREGHMVREFVEAVRRGTPLRPDFRDGARVQRLIEACLESARAGCWAGCEDEGKAEEP